VRPVPDITYDFLAEHELCVLRVYDDLRPTVVLKRGDVAAGTLTAGYGHTGPDVKIGMRVTQEMADRWLREDVATAAERLWTQIGVVVEDLTENQYAALLSFVFNVGADPSWTIWKRLKARQFDQIPVEMMRFVNAKGKKRPGLVNRRAAEVILWSTDEPGTEDIRLTSASLRDIDTPPVVADPTPARKDKTIWGAVTAAVGAALAWIGNMLAQIPEFAHTALNAINPFAEKSEFAQFVANGVGGLAAVAGIYVAWSVVKKKGESKQ